MLIFSVYVCENVYICECMWECVCELVWMCVWICVEVCEDVSVCVQVRMQVCVHVYTHRQQHTYGSHRTTHFSPSTFVWVSGIWCYYYPVSFLHQHITHMPQNSVRSLCQEPGGIGQMRAILRETSAEVNTESFSSTTPCSQEQQPTPPSPQ